MPFSIKNGRPSGAMACRHGAGRTIMPISLADLHFAASLKEMSDEDFLLAWQGGNRRTR